MQTQQKSSDDAMRAAAAKAGLDPESMVHGMGEFIKQTPGSFVVQVENTLFLCIPDDKLGVEFHIFSDVGNPQVLAALIFTLAAELRDAKYKTLYIDTSDPALLRVVPMTRLPASITPSKDREGNPAQRWTARLQ